MRTLLTLPILCIIVFLAACSTTQFHYSSSADISHYHISRSTVMNIVSNENDRSRQYGVLTAVDDETNEYLLIAEKRLGRNKISDYRITDATYIDLQAAQSFNNLLQEIISRWDRLEENDGFFYEFASAPQINVQNIDNENLRMHPTVRFFFNVSNEGSTGELIFKYNDVRRRVSLDSKESIKDLQNLIQLGLEYFEVI